MLHAIMLIFIAVGTTTYFAVRMESRVLTDGLIGMGRHMVRNISFSAEKAFWTVGWLLVEEMLQGLKQERGEVIYAKIVKPSGEVYLADNRASYGDMIDLPLLCDRDTILKNHYFTETGEDGMLLVHPFNIGNERWYAMLGLSLKSIESAIRHLIIRNVGWGSAIVLLGILGSFLLSRSISNPIITLSKATRTVSQGNWDHDVKVKSKDEVGLLSHSFNRMIAILKRAEESLQRAHDELERRVEERTAQLAKANEELQGEISERKQAEEALKESEEKYRTILESIEEGYFEVDLEGNLTFFNNALGKISGYSRGELLGLNNRQYMDKENAKKVYQTFNKVYKTGEPTKGFEYEIVPKKEVAIKYLESSVSLIKDGAGRPVGFRGLIRDITERKHTEKERQKLEGQLQRAKKMEAIGTLAGGVAHDLNNVLAGMVSYPELLLMQIPENSPLREPIGIIKKSGEKAAAIVQDLLTLARRGVPAAEVVNLNDIISDYIRSPVWERLKSFHPEVRLETDLESDLLNILGSPVHLSKTVMNLVSNAAEAMPDGGTVSISTENRYIDEPSRGYDDVRKGDYAVLTASDTGVGISAGDMERIFEPFYTKKTMGRSGTGLGMAVVWGTVRDHKGYIDVQSTEGKGTTFTLYFPVTRKGAAKEKPVVSIDDYMGKGESVLVVDDVEEQREIASRLLKKLGYSVASVSGGEEAVDYLRNNSTDLLVLDMIMDPGIDGLETYKRILEFHPQQKAIIASGFSETDRVKEARRLGVGAYLKKPYSLEKIGLAIRAELEQKVRQ
jgi:two-component system cell cycle sensor histidine kinase/response regulator CckA